MAIWCNAGDVEGLNMPSSLRLLSRWLRRRVRRLVWAPQPWVLLRAPPWLPAQGQVCLSSVPSFFTP